MTPSCVARSMMGLSLRLGLAATIVVTVAGCRQNPAPADAMAYALGTIGGFGELINSGVKKLALSESSLLVTDLFPADVAKGKDVLLIYQGTIKDEYLALKAEALGLAKAGQDTGRAREIGG